MWTIHVRVTLSIQYAKSPKTGKVRGSLMIRGIRLGGMLIVVAAWWALLVPAAMAFHDDEACLMCHKYPMLGRVTDDGAVRSYNVVPELFADTVHRNVPCRDCHTEIRELPHKPVEQGVQCSTECHSVTNPSTGKPFSHQATYDKYRGSVHGRDKNATGAERDKPYCVSCHRNPYYNPREDAPPAHITERCNVCHENGRFSETWYNHTGRRINQVKRDSREINALCTSCHGDQHLIERRLQNAEAEGRELGSRFAVAAESYKKSFHGKMSTMGREASANCLDCHIDASSYFENVHALYSTSDERSPVHAEQRAETCARCHSAANERYAAIDPHPTKVKELSPFNHYANIIYDIIGNSALLLLLGMAAFETLGRRRDGASWGFRHGTSWLRYRRRQGDR